MANGQAAAVVVVGMGPGARCIDMVRYNPGSHQGLWLDSYTINVNVV